MGRSGCQDLLSSLSATPWLITIGRQFMNLVTSELPELPEPQALTGGLCGLFI